MTSVPTIATPAPAVASRTAVVSDPTLPNSPDASDFALHYNGLAHFFARFAPQPAPTRPTLPPVR